MAINVPNGHKVYQMAIKYTNIFNSKTLPNLTKMGFLVLKYTIRQPCTSRLRIANAVRTVVDIFLMCTFLKVKMRAICFAMIQLGKYCTTYVHMYRVT
jgi:hypothetical protein